MVDIPCIQVPKAEPLSVSLPFGGQLSTIVHPGMGPPSDCDVVHSLMLQITPLMASMTCLLAVLNVVNALKNAATATPPIVGGITEITDAIDKMTDCLGIVLGPLPLCKMVKDVLKLIIAYLNCLIDSIDSILNFQIGIDLNAAHGDPVLLAHLECAQENAQRTMEGMMNSMQGLEPIFELINMVLSIADQDPIEPPDLSAETPSLADLADGVDPLEPIRTIVEVLEITADALPC